MDTQEMIRDAVCIVARRLIAGGPAADGARPEGDAVDALHDVLLEALNRSQAGRERLAWLTGDPASVHHQQETAQHLSACANADPQLRGDLDRAVRQVPKAVRSEASINATNMGAGHFLATTGNDSPAVIGTYKRFHIGNLHFGFGGLVGGIAAIIIAAAGGGAVVAAAGSDTPTAQYRRQVLATCSQTTAIMDTDHSAEIYSLSMPGGFTTAGPSDPQSFITALTNPAYMVVVNKSGLLTVLADQVAQVQAAFRDLDAQPIPNDLRTQKHQVDTALAAWVSDRQAGIAQVKKKAKATMTQPAFDALGIDVTGSGSGTAAIDLDSAMTGLAGADCSAV